MVRRLIFVLALGAGLLNSQKPSDIDFRQFTFPFPPTPLSTVPDHVKWMDANAKTTVTLVNGRREFERNGPSVTLDQIRYGYLTMSGQLDAMVVLNYRTGGTAQWHYVYAFSLASGQPKLLGWLQTGSRANFGLYRVLAGNGEFALDLLDPEKKEAECCSAGFIRTRYLWQSKKFTETGPPEYGRVAETPKRR